MRKQSEDSFVNHEYRIDRLLIICISQLSSEECDDLTLDILSDEISIARKPSY